MPDVINYMLFEGRFMEYGSLITPSAYRTPLKLPSAPLGSKEYGSLKADLSGAVKGDA
jgi:hypothetical protein